MSDEEKRSDAELQAMLALIKYLDPLTRGARQRVLHWAQDRFIREEIPELDADYFTKFVEAVQEAARELGTVRPLDIIVAANEFAKHRDETNAAEESS